MPGFHRITIDWGDMNTRFNQKLNMNLIHTGVCVINVHSVGGLFYVTSWHEFTQNVPLCHTQSCICTPVACTSRDLASVEESTMYVY